MLSIGRWDKKFTAMIAAAAVLSIIAIVFGYLGYPVNGTNDAIYFMPPSVNLALHHGFTNPVTRKEDVTVDPSGQQRFLFYTPLFPMVVSLFISPQFPLSYPRQAFLALGAMNAFALVLTCWIFYKVASMHKKKLSWFAVSLICLALLITLRISWGFGGRPEVLAHVFVVAGFLAMLYGNRRSVFIGVLALFLGLIAATHPGGAALFAVAIGMFFSFRYEWRDAVRDAAATYFLGGLIFLLAMQFSPFGLRETFSGMTGIITGRTALLGGNGNPFLLSVKHLMNVLASDFSSPYKILIFLVMVLVLIFAIDIYRKIRSWIKSPFLFACSSVAFAGLIVYFANESRNNYITLFSALVLAALLYYVIHVSNSKMVKYGALAVMLILAAVAAQAIILFPFFIKNGVGIDAARTAFEKIALAHPAATYFFTYHLWTLSENYNAMDTFEKDVLGDLDPNEKMPPHTMILWGQAQDNYNALAAPPSMRECPLVATNFVTEVPKIFGVRLAQATPSYAFAAYACP